MIKCEKCGVKITKKNFVNHKHKEYVFVDNEKKEVRSICEKEYTGYGNNANPMTKGRCCDSCNEFFVIPARQTEILRRIKQNEKKIRKFD